MNTLPNLKCLAAVAVLALGLSMISCSSSEEQIPSGEAMFDSFSYVGNDSFYHEHPLQGESDFYNPILPGFYPDPALCTNGKGDYYLATSSFTYFPGVPIFHSRDLVNWKQIGHVLERESQMENMLGQHVSGGIFAPGLSYNPKTGTYYMITTNVGAGNFLVKTQDPAGDWSDPIHLPSVQGIDPSIFIDDDGKAYVVNNDDAPDGKPEYPGHRTVRLQELDLNTDQMVGERRILINKGCRPEEKPIWCEAPHIYKINHMYYLMTAEGGTGDWHSEVIYRSKSVWGPYKPYPGNPILTQRTLDNNRPEPVTCAGHADLIQAAEGDWWAVFLACRPVEKGYENLGRETFMLPVTWTADGWPIICPNGEVVKRVLCRSGVKRQKDVTFGNFERLYNFNDSTLDMNWMTLRTSGAEKYSLTKHPGWLTLRQDSVTIGQMQTPAMVCHRIQHHAFSCQTLMRYRPTSSGDIAGLVLYKDETHHVIFGLTSNEEGQQVVCVRQVTPEGEEIIDAKPVKKGELTLKIDSDGRSFSFLFSENGKDWTNIEPSLPAAFLSTRDAGGFCGTTLGLYCTGK